MTAEAELTELLRARGAEAMEDPGGALYAHLERVHCRLARLGAPETLQLAFADLSLVNELDVAEHSPGFLDRHGEFSRCLAAGWEPLLSSAVGADARRVLGLAPMR